MSHNQFEKAAFGVKLARTRDIPTRFAFAILVGSNRFWAGFIIGLPLVCLLATRIHTAFVSFAAGLPVGICLWLLWMSHEFVHPQLVINHDEQTLTKSKPYDSGDYSAIDAGDIDRVSIIRFSDAALVKLHYSTSLHSRPLSTAVTASSVDELESCLKQVGLEVTRYEATLHRLSANPIHVRIAATPVVIIGSLLLIWNLYGFEAFSTGAVVIPTITAVGFALYGYVWRQRVRRSGYDYSN